jgi:hypothetical protein
VNGVNVVNRVATVDRLRKRPPLHRPNNRDAGESSARSNASWASSPGRAVLFPRTGSESQLCHLPFERQLNCCTSAADGL